MATVVMDRGFAELLRQERAAAGSDRWDEVWEGTYMMAPLPNIEHQDLIGAIVEALRQILPRGQGIVLPGTNVSDREVGWKHNYRCPDVAVYLAGTRAKKCGTHWCGGPDFAVEIVSPDDMVRDKIPFYGKVRTRELLIVDRDPWSLELLRLSGTTLKSAGRVMRRTVQPLSSHVLSSTFRFATGEERPSIMITRSSDSKSWQV